MHDEMALSPRKPATQFSSIVRSAQAFLAGNGWHPDLPCGAEIDAAQAIPRPVPGLAKACRCT
jgi:hypothetical protein